jgi:hypothetical protein
VTIDSRTSRWWNDSSSHWVDRVHWIKWVRLVEWSNRIIFDMKTRSIYTVISTLKSLWKKRNSSHLLIVYWSFRSTHFEMFRLITFWSINVLRIVKALLLIMKSVELLISCIHLTFVISRRSYDCRRLMTSIMKRFFWVVSSRTRQSYKDFESMHKTSEMNISRMFETIFFRVASRSKSWVIAYNSAARTLRVIRLHFIDDQWITFALDWWW